MFKEKLAPLAIKLKEYEQRDKAVNPNPILKISRLHRTDAFYYGAGVLIKYGKVFFQFATIELIKGSLRKGLYSASVAHETLSIFSEVESAKILADMSCCKSIPCETQIGIGKRFSGLPRLASQESRDNKKLFVTLFSRLKKESSIPLIIFDNTHE